MSGMIARASAISRLWSVLLLFVTFPGISPSPAMADAAADADCLLCHDASFDEPVNRSWHVLHSTRDSRVAADAVFSGENPSPVETQNAACVTCHRGDKQTWWAGSEHDDADLTCSQCHTVHVNENPTADHIAVSGLCFQCHAQVRSAARMRSRHPIEEGRTTCADCHNPHGSSTNPQ